jgi:hypothetical protein
MPLFECGVQAPAEREGGWIKFGADPIDVAQLVLLRAREEVAELGWSY